MAPRALLSKLANGFGYVPLIESYIRKRPEKEKPMKAFLKKLVKDENGGEILEYALIAGLIVVAAIAVITAVGGKVLARWNSLNAGM